MNVSVKVTFLVIERPPHRFRYIGSIWPRVHYLDGVDTSCRLMFPEDVEACDGDTVELKMSFLDDEIHQSKMYEGMPFELYICSVKIAEGQVLRLEM
ncbi:hypothetical protein [Shewanella sp. KCT]|uniref:hypothetical protein n=1 Tax=Shewanella sp. KCT TaxID=2569535 RepID=UPI001C9302A7|nr:hypothetical protein [Shewanella sp. KCT]TVP14570.1 hypothetical protein AYI87_09320 [Shewanella sp. KCT]